MTIPGNMRKAVAAVTCREVLGEAIPGIGLCATGVNGAVALIQRRMHANSITFSILDRQARHYVLKVPPSMEYKAILFNEAYGSNLARYMGLPVAEWVSLDLHLPTIKTFGQYRAGSDPTALAVLRGGTFLASVVAHEPGTICEFLPHAAIRSTEVATHMVCMKVFDLWASQTGMRQYLAHKLPDRNSYRVRFIRNSSLFDESEKTSWLNLDDRNPYIQATRFGVAPNVVDALLDRFSQTDINLLTHIASGIPREWIPPYGVERVAGLLKQRTIFMERYRREWRRVAEACYQASYLETRPGIL